MILMILPLPIVIIADDSHNICLRRHIQWQERQHRKELGQNKTVLGLRRPLKLFILIFFVDLYKYLWAAEIIHLSL